jgi:hypothetical protein
MKTYRVWHYNDFIEIAEGQEVTVFRCGSGLSVFGERSFLEKGTKQHLVFKTESGATVKTKIDNIHYVIGKASQDRYCISTRKYNDFEGIIHQTVSF